MPKQAPHLIHFLGSITATPFFRVIAPTGQTPVQAPQPTQTFLSTLIMFSPIILYQFYFNK